MEPTDYKYLFLDMNSFFASVEQQESPALRGKPVAVAPHTGPSGCVIAASYEAKAHGVTTGWRVGEALQKIPELVVVPAHPRLYMTAHNKIKNGLQKFSPWVVARSVDEFSILLSPGERNLDTASRIAMQVKQSIKDEAGEWLTASVGIAPNLFLSKLATDLMKPNGFVVITLDTLEKTFAKISDLKTLYGINRAGAARLKLHDLDTPLKLWQASPRRLHEVFGTAGERWYLNLHGEDINLPREMPKSVSHSHVLEPALRNKAAARQVMLKLAKNVAQRLRQSHLLASHISVGVGDKSYSNGEKHHTYLRLRKNIHSSCSTHDITTTTLDLFEQCCRNTPYFLAVAATGITRSSGQQLSLLRDTGKSIVLDEIIDKINDRMGPETIMPASLLAVDEAAPYRIAFNALHKPTTKN